MPMLNIGQDDAIYYEWTPPSTPGAPSFVFINPITGDTSLWTGTIVPAVTAAGFGALVYDFRGQGQSRYAPGLKLDDGVIVADLERIVAHVAPPKPVLTGLSIGGLYAARAIQNGMDAAGLVLINTLRRMTPRVEWMNAATMRAMEIGGPNLMKDLYFHLLVGEKFQAANRAAFLPDEPDYTPLDPNSGAYNLVTWMGKTSWELDWSTIETPSLVLTGLQDRVFFDAANVDALASSMPNATRQDMPDAGHMLPVETPEPFIEAILGFARDLDAAG